MVYLHSYDIRTNSSSQWSFSCRGPVVFEGNQATSQISHPIKTLIGICRLAIEQQERLKTQIQESHAAAGTSTARIEVLRQAIADVEAFETRQQLLQGCFEARCSCLMLTVCLPAPDVAQPVTGTRPPLVACTDCSDVEGIQSSCSHSLLAHPMCCNQQVTACLHACIPCPSR